MISARVHAEGRLLDSGLMARFLGAIVEGGGRYEIVRFDAGRTKRDESSTEIDVRAATRAALDRILGALAALGCRAVDDADARLVPAPKDGVAPDGFYSTTHHRTRVRVAGKLVVAERPRMDAMVVVRGGRARCVLLRDLRRGDAVVCGEGGVDVESPQAESKGEGFSFMRSDTSSERAVENKARDVAVAMRGARRRGGKLVLVAGPVVVHTGGAPHLAALIRRGWVDALLAGNALAVHDAELALFGTSLGVDLATGLGAREGHMHHLRAINSIRKAGSLAAAVRRGVLKSGIFFECVRAGVPFSLAGSIRDDGPIPDTKMDLIAAQKQYAELLEGAGLVLVLGSMLHGIGVGNMLPGDVPLVCVDIHPGVVTKLADRGSVQTIGVVTDVSVFLHTLSRRLSR
jgi:lysine-ketoglutarate reductase/saccharopine dehydrogenase-like protein (TIGR00300 family)